MRLIVSPHLDDATLGCGAYLAQSRERILTVFAGCPDDDDTLTAYDRSCGFSSSREAMTVRSKENAAAVDELGCSHMAFGFLDRQYDSKRPSVSALADAIQRSLADIFQGVIGPLGIQHPDHVLVSEACLLLANRNLAVWLYEELPYRVVWPEAAAARLDAVRDHGWHLVPDFLGAGPLEQKERAVRAYASQSLDMHCCLVPERFWAVTK